MRKVFFVFLLVFILILPAVARADLNDGLVAYYPFNGDVKDYSGNGNDGELHGAVLTNDRFGNPNSAYYFDGNSIILAKKVLQGFNNHTPFSISVWIKTTTTKFAGGIVTRWSACYNEAVNDHFHLTLYHDYLRGEVNGYGSADVNRNLVADGKWHHLVMVFTGKKIIIYIDGNLKNEKKSTTSYFVTSNLSFALGGFVIQSCSQDHHFIGSIDEVRIYNRALSESEIEELYEQGLNNCSGGGYTEADLQKKYSEGFEAGKEYCKKNPSACGITISSSTDCSSNYQSGYNNGYNKGYEDGKNSCSGTSQENPFLPPTTSSQCATFDFVSNIFSVPCFETGKSTYSLDFKLINTKPVQLELTNVKKK